MLFMGQRKAQGLCAQTCSVELGSARQTPRCQFVIFVTSCLHIYDMAALPRSATLSHGGSAAAAVPQNIGSPLPHAYLWRQCRLANKLGGSAACETKYLAQP